MNLRYLNVTTIRWEKWTEHPENYGSSSHWVRIPRTIQKLQFFVHGVWVDVPEIHETVDEAQGPNPDMVAFAKAAEDWAKTPAALDFAKSLQDAIHKPRETDE